jgi:hypothetical protein
MSPLGLGATYPAPTFLYEYNPTLGVFTNVTPPASVLNQSLLNTFNDAMLVLPTTLGPPQLLLTSGGVNLAFYNLAPFDGPAPGWAPTITNFTRNADGSYTLTGTQLNGLDEGAAYGDDKQMAENYPLVQLIDLFTGTVYYATTSNWSSTGVATGNTSETVNVVLPPGISSTGNVPFLLFVVADGIPSVPIVPFFGGPGANIVVNGTTANQSDAGQLVGTSAAAAPGAESNSPLAFTALVLNVSNDTSPPASKAWPTFDSGSDNSMSAPVSPTRSNPAQFSAALNETESMQWAALNAAIDILGA